MPKYKIDEPAPDFTLTDMHGEPFTLSSQYGDGPAVLVFARSFL